MATRKVILATGEIYHIFNRSTHGIPIFKSKRAIDNFLEAARFYLSSTPPVKFSVYRKGKYNNLPDLSRPLVKIIAYCLMPNHFHFILLQSRDSGIKIYLQKLIGSYSHYFNLKKEQKGPLFESRFKAVRVETEEQLLHLSRYIHLNPVTAYLSENPAGYSYSSFPAYLGEESFLPIETSMILSCFSSAKKYQEFVLARKEYQRELDKIKHLLLEEP